MNQIDYPFHFGSRGRTAAIEYEDHLRDLIEQVLFTAPGERVNRPTFGCGVLQLVFAPNSDELSAASQMLIQSSLQQWLGDLITVQAVTVSNDDTTLHIQVDYIPLHSQQLLSAQFTSGWEGS